MSWRINTELSNSEGFNIRAHRERVDRHQMAPLHAKSSVIMEQGRNNTLRYENKMSSRYFGVSEIICRCCSFVCPRSLINKYDYVVCELLVECYVVSYGRNSMMFRMRLLPAFSGSLAVLAACLFYSSTLKMEAIYSSRKVHEHILDYMASGKYKIVWNLHCERLALCFRLFWLISS
jgi:hypothetical protein